MRGAVGWVERTRNPSTGRDGFRCVQPIPRPYPIAVSNTARAPINCLPLQNTRVFCEMTRSRIIIGADRVRSVGGDQRRRFEVPASPAASSFRNFKSISGTEIKYLLVPLCFRSSCQRGPRCITNFGNGALVMTQPRLKHFGWGREGEDLTPDEEAFVLGRITQQFGPPGEREVTPPRLEEIKLAPPRIKTPASLPFCSTAHYDRAAHTYGKSFPDYVRGLAGDYANAPDVVAYPRSEDEVAAVRDWAAGAQASVTPFGGGSSVVGGVEPQRDPARHKGTVTIDLRELGRVIEGDKTSRAARIEAGAFGPALEAQLKPHNLTLRHFPQSFDCSTLGGWIG